MNPTDLQITWTHGLWVATSLRTLQLQCSYIHGSLSRLATPRPYHHHALQHASKAS